MIEKSGERRDRREYEEEGRGSECATDEKTEEDREGASTIRQVQKQGT